MMGNPTSRNYIERRGRRGFGVSADNTPNDMGEGRAILDQASALPISPVPMDRSTVTSVFDSRPINAVDAWATRNTITYTIPPPF